MVNYIGEVFVCVCRVEKDREWKEGRSEFGG